MISDFIRGIVAYMRALSFMAKKGFGKYFIYSGLIGLVLFAVSGYIIYSMSPMLAGFIQGLIPWDIDVSTTVSGWVSIIFSSVIFLTIFKYLMLIFTAPLMSVLSEKVESELTGQIKQKTTVINIVSEIMRGFRINIRNIIRELFITIVLLVLSFIPLVGVVSGVAILIVQGYYAGFGNYDFWAERHFSYRDTILFMRSNKGKLCGNGVVFVFLLAIPILGAFIAPPLATVAATIEGTKELELND